MTSELVLHNPAMQCGSPNRLSQSLNSIRRGGFIPRPDFLRSPETGGPSPELECGSDSACAADNYMANNTTLPALTDSNHG